MCHQQPTVKFLVILNRFGFKIGEVMILHRCALMLEWCWARINLVPAYDDVSIANSPLHRSDDLFAIVTLVLKGAIFEFVQEFSAMEHLYGRAPVDCGGS